MSALETLLQEIRGCRHCAAVLPHGPRPVLQAGSSARILLAGQAPGRRVHASGLPFDDPSGERLRSWLGLDRAQFYDRAQIAIVPMGFCYPGTERGADLPPRPECAPLWRARVLDLLPHIELTVLIGQYALDWHLGDPGRGRRSVTERVMAWRESAPRVFPLPHPSPRNIAWFRRNAWFEQEVVPQLRQRVGELLALS
jgi:uracil-DNA glycosylase